MDFPYPGFLPAAFGQNGPWWFSFYQTRDIPEALIQGNERGYISWFMKGLVYNPAAITEKDIDVWTSHAVKPGGLRGSFEHFRAFPVDAEQNKEIAKSKNYNTYTSLGGDIYPALGGDYPGNFAYSSLQSLATNVTGIISSTFRTLDSRRATTICNRSAIQILWKIVPIVLIVYVIRIYQETPLILIILIF